MHALKQPQQQQRNSSNNAKGSSGNAADAGGYSGMMRKDNQILQKRSENISEKNNLNQHFNQPYDYNPEYANIHQETKNLSYIQQSIAVNREVKKLANSITFTPMLKSPSHSDLTLSNAVAEGDDKKKDKKLEIYSDQKPFEIHPLDKSATKTKDNTSIIDKNLSSNINNTISGDTINLNQRIGVSLDSNTKSIMESQFKHNFSHVRIHADGAADRSAQSVKAAAYTIGNNIVFNSRYYAPSSIAGQRLLAHELTHIVQQEQQHQGGEQKKLNIQSSSLEQGQESSKDLSDSLEQEAKQTSIKVDSGQQITVYGRTPKLALQKQEEQQHTEQNKHWWEDVIDFGKEQIWLLIKEFAPELEPILKEVVNEGIIEWLNKKIFSAVDTLVNSLLEPVHDVENVVKSLSDHFAELVNWIKGAAVKLSQGDCSALKEAVEKIEKVIEGITSPIVDKVKELAGKASAFFTNLWNRFGAPVLDWIKKIGGQAWEKIQQFGNWLWEKTAKIRDTAGRAWKWIKEKIGIGEEPENQNGIIQWIERKVSEVWNKIKDRIEPIKRPLMVVGGILALLSPAGPFLAIGVSIFGLIQGIRWIRQYMGSDDGVVKNRNILQDIVIPTITGAIKGFTQKLQDVSRSIFTKINSVVGGLTQAIGAISSSIISFAVSTFQWIADKFQSLADWANEKLMSLVDWASTGLERLIHFLQPVFDFLKQVGEVVIDVFKLPFIIGGQIWNAIPACIRDPFVQFLTDHILKRIPIFNQLLKVQNIWEKIKPQVMDIIKQIFKNHDLKGALVNVFKLLLQAFNIPIELVTGIFTKAAAAFDLIVNDPIGFLSNMLGALKLGFSNFFGSILTHLLNGVTDWLFDGLKEKNIQKPRNFSFMSIFNFVLDILDIQLESIFSKLEKKIGPEKVKILRTTTKALGEAWEWINILIKEGPGGLWKKVTGKLNDLWSIFIDGIIGWISDKVVKAVKPKLLSFLDATGIMPVINGIISIYNAINSAVKYVVKILQIVNSILDTTIAIASGSIGPAAQKLEDALDRSTPVVIGFLADQLGLDDPSEAIGNIVVAIRIKVDEAIDWLIDKAFELGGALLESFGLTKKTYDKPVNTEPGVFNVKQKALNEVNMSLKNKKVSSIDEFSILIHSTLENYRQEGLKSLTAEISDDNFKNININAFASPTDNITISWEKTFHSTDLTTKEREELEELHDQFIGSKERKEEYPSERDKTFAILSFDGRYIGSAESTRSRHAEDILINSDSWKNVIEFALKMINNESSMADKYSEIAIAINRTPCPSCTKNILLGAVRDIDPIIKKYSHFILAATGTYEPNVKTTQEERDKELESLKDLLEKEKGSKLTYNETKNAMEELLKEKYKGGEKGITTAFNLRDLSIEGWDIRVLDLGVKKQSIDLKEWLEKNKSKFYREFKKVLS